MTVELTREEFRDALRQAAELLAPVAAEAACARARALERARVRAILTAPQAPGRNSNAIRLALDTDAPPAAAGELLAGAPLEIARLGAGTPAKRAQRKSPASDLSASTKARGRGSDQVAPRVAGRRRSRRSGG